MSARYPEYFELEMHVDANVGKVWECITNPFNMRNWMLDEPVYVGTGCQTGDPMIIAGELQGKPFTTTGWVEQFQPLQCFGYSMRSSLSDLPDEANSYSHLSFQMAEKNAGVDVLLRVHGFPTFEIYKHLEYYWKVTLPVLKRYIEQANKFS